MAANLTGGRTLRVAGLGAFSSLRSPWAAPVFLVPFLLMLAIHQILGLSDALLAADNPGERPAHGFNLLLGMNMNLCPFAAGLHLCVKSQRTLPWILAKLLIPMMFLLLGVLLLLAQDD